MSRPALQVCLQSKLYSSLKKTCVDVYHYNKDEIRVKAHPQYVTIEGKQEQDTKQGYVLRQFMRNFKLPDGCVPSKVKCIPGPQGMMQTVEAQRSFKDANTPADMVIVPISYCLGKINKKETVMGHSSGERHIYVNPCDKYPKVRPKPESKPERSPEVKPKSESKPEKSPTVKPKPESKPAKSPQARPKHTSKPGKL